MSEQVTQRVSYTPFSRPILASHKLTSASQIHLHCQATCWIRSTCRQNPGPGGSPAICFPNTGRVVDMCCLPPVSLSHSGGVGRLFFLPTSALSLLLWSCGNELQLPFTHSLCQSILPLTFRLWLKILLQEVLIAYTFEPVIATTSPWPLESFVY